MNEVIIATVAVLITIPFTLIVARVWHQISEIEVTRPDPYVFPAFPLDVPESWQKGLIECVHLTDDIAGDVTIDGTWREYEFMNVWTGAPYTLSDTERDFIDFKVDEILEANEDTVYDYGEGGGWKLTDFEYEDAA